MSTELPTLPALAIFAVAARHQNFARAAEELGLTASAVSHHVRSLESVLGIALFERHARGAHFTIQGRMLADTVGAALSDIDALVASLRRSPRNVNHLRIATLHSLNYCWILPRLRAFTDAHPSIRVTFDAGVALARFDKNGPDLSIRHGDGYWPGMTTNHLMDEELFPAASPALAGRCDLRDVAALPLITDLAFQGWPDWFRFAGSHGKTAGHAHIQRFNRGHARCKSGFRRDPRAQPTDRTLSARRGIGALARPGDESPIRLFRRVPRAPAAQQACRGISRMAKA